MPDTSKYVNKRSNDGTFSCKISPSVNKMLDIYCEINDINKTALVNDTLDRLLREKFSKLKEG